MNTKDALALAREKGLDLVEVASNRRPPVCKIVDYGKLKYDEKKKAKEKRAKQSKIEIKEIKFRPLTDTHDMDFKCRHVRKFITEGNRCKLVMFFRGRERAHKELGADVLWSVADRMNDIADVIQSPTNEEGRMMMLLGPKSAVTKRATG